MTIVAGVPPFHTSGTHAERRASGAADSRSDAGAQAIGSRLHADVRPAPAEAPRDVGCFRTQEPHSRAALAAPHVATSRVRRAVSRRPLQLPAYAMYAWPASPMWIWQQRSRASKSGTA